MLVFTKMADVWLARLVVGAACLCGMGVAGLYYYGPPEYTRVGFAPSQPVPFSHQQHAGQLGMSCLYCHSNVDRAPAASVPATQICMNCHKVIKPASPQLAAIRESATGGQATGDNA